MQSKYIMVRSGETLFRERALQNHCSHPDSSQSSNGIDKIWWCPNRNYDDFNPLTEYLSVSWQLPDDVSIHPSPIETALLSRYMHSISDCVFDMHLSMTELNNSNVIYMQMNVILSYHSNVLKFLSQCWRYLSMASSSCHRSHFQWNLNQKEKYVSIMPVLSQLNICKLRILIIVFERLCRTIQWLREWRCLD